MPVNNNGHPKILESKERFQSLPLNQQDSSELILVGVTEGASNEGIGLSLRTSYPPYKPGPAPQPEPILKNTWKTSLLFPANVTSRIVHRTVTTEK